MRRVVVFILTVISIAICYGLWWILSLINCWTWLLWTIIIIVASINLFIISYVHIAYKIGDSVQKRIESIINKKL